jgi:uncharacterized protein YjbI with pentapeptide repeats
MRYGLSRADIWRTGCLLAVAALVIVGELLGWSRVGHALTGVAGPVGRTVWTVFKVGWPAVLAVEISLLLGKRSRKRLLEVATGIRQGMADGRWLVVAVVVGIAGLLVVVLVAPSRFVHDRSLEGLRVQNEIRTTLLQGLGGAVLVVGAYLTYRQLRTTREGQVTERYTRAIDQLGHPQLDVRIGGIYALERIARDSPTDRATIGEVLAAFVRSHAPWPPRLPGQYIATAPIDEVPELQVRAPDVQASLTVLGRGGFARPEGRGDRLDLHAVDLRHAHLVGADLERAYLRGARLEGANLMRASLERADLMGARLERAVLGGAKLVEANLEGARLEGANLKSASLQRAYLRGARLEGADLGRAYLERARLMGVDLERANLEGADLERANLDGAHFEEANLVVANLKGAYLVAVHLEGADLRGAQLEGADLASAILAGAYLMRAHLAGAKLMRANLEGADLRSTDLEGADLGGARLEGAVADEHTAWPAGFDWRAAGVIVAGEDAAASPPPQA